MLKFLVYNDKVYFYGFSINDFSTVPVVLTGKLICVDTEGFPPKPQKNGPQIDHIP